MLDKNKIFWSFGYYFHHWSPSVWFYRSSDIITDPSSIPKSEPTANRNSISSSDCTSEHVPSSYRLGWTTFFVLDTELKHYVDILRTLSKYTYCKDYIESAWLYTLSLPIKDLHIFWFETVRRGWRGIHSFSRDPLLTKGFGSSKSPVKNHVNNCKSWKF